MIGSPIGPCAGPCAHAACPGNRALALETLCDLCHHPVSGALARLWRDPDTRAITTARHVGCIEEQMARERAELNRPTIIEAAADRAKLTIEAFRNLDSWVRDRLAREELWREAETEAAAPASPSRPLGERAG